MNIKFGCCGSTINSDIDKIGINIIEALKKIGFDYIELSLRDIAQLSNRDFLLLKKRIYLSGLKCEVCNNFYPENIKLTGLDTNNDTILRYLEKALFRAKQIGVEVIVLGSPFSKNLPDGFSGEKAWGQMIEKLRLINLAVKKNKITVVIEPINRNESNFIIKTKEAYQLVKEVGRENIQLLVDYYHFSLEEEDPKILLEINGLLKHVHFSRIKNRSFPIKIEEDPNYLPFISNLKGIGYQHRVSIEAYTDNFINDATKSLRFLKNSFS